MKKYFFVLCVFLLVVGVSHAQRFVIRGSVVDAETKELLPHAQLRVTDKDTLLVAATVADAEGHFAVQLKRAGKYMLEVSFLGCETLHKSVTLTEKKPNQQLGRLMLKPDRTLLREAQITGLANELTIKADTFVYHTNAFRVPEGSSIAAVIKQLPGVSMDSDGNLTFQGKTVGSILVNGKPFFGDANTAMSNMASEAVQDLQIYEKTDEDKEFTGQHDSDKQTVIDLKIKKEYESSWNVNVDLGGGTHDRFIGKVFASNFTDKRRTAVYAQTNNISQNQTVDENGNWSYWGGGSGFYTYRKAGTILSWDNGKKNKEGGYFSGNIDASLGHDNSRIYTMVNRETFLGKGAHFSYSDNRQRGRENDVRLDGDFKWNIDTLNRISLDVKYSYSDLQNSDDNSSSTYKNEPQGENLYNGLIGDDVSPTLAAQGVYSNKYGKRYKSHGNEFRLFGTYNHRMRNSGNSFGLEARVYMTWAQADADYMNNYRYFTDATGQPLSVERRYEESPSYNYEYVLTANYSWVITKEMQYSFHYHYGHSKEDGERNLYLLDRYAGYNAPYLPLGVRPSTADSLLAVIDPVNSNNAVTYENTHILSAVFTGEWEKVRFSVIAHAGYNNERLYYRTPETRYSPSRNYMGYSVFAALRLKPFDNGHIILNYYGSQENPSLRELLPITDTSNSMVINLPNPELSTTWNNAFTIRGNKFNDKRGDNYNFYAHLNLTNNAKVITAQTDAATGKQYMTKDNVSGNYNGYIRLSTQQPLDSARHWTLSATLSSSLWRQKNYVGSVGDALGLSVVKGYSPNLRLGLKWRKDIWSVNLSGSYNCEITRYKSAPQYNESGNVLEWSLEPQVDFPFGLKLHTSFGLFKRTGYEDEMLNHEQWLWNATVSQSFLKSKALTLQLELVDILHQRTSEYSSHSATERYFRKIDTFLSYAMLHLIYRFNLGGKQ